MAEASTEVDVDTLLQAVNAKYKWNYRLKDAQRKVITEVMHRRHVLCVLPTGYGKSLCYMMIALMYDEVRELPLTAAGDQSLGKIYPLKRGFCPRVERYSHML